MARVMALALVVGLFPAGMAQSASAVELPEDEIKEMWEIALENGYTHYDTIDLCGGNSHMQGICVDDKMEYMYFSYTSALAKVEDWQGGRFRRWLRRGKLRYPWRRPLGLSGLL